MFDKIKAMSAPPGHSLTGEPGKWAWEQPPRFSDPNDAIDFIVDKLDERIPQEFRRRQCPTKSLLHFIKQGI